MAGIEGELVSARQASRVMAQPAAPFYATHPCGTCRGAVGPDGVFVTDDQKWCRPCAMRLRDLLNATLPVVQI